MPIVYNHTKPNGEIFYIGIGVVKKRAYSVHGRNKHWHNTVNKYGYNVKIVCNDVDYETAKQIETYLIKYYGRKDLGFGNLVNMTDGGEGGTNMSKEEKNKRSIRMTEYNKIKKDYSFTQKKEYKEKMAISSLDKGCKRIENTLTNKIYNSLKDAAKELNINYSSLSMMINNKRPNKTNLKWILEN